MLKNITPLQWLGIILIANGVIIGGTGELTNLFGSEWASHFVSVASLGNAFVGGLITLFSGQVAVVNSVSKMAGVEKVVVNNQAAPALLQMAADPATTKITSTGG